MPAQAVLNALKREHRSLRVKMRQLADAIAILSKRTPRPKTRRVKVKKGA